VELITLLSSKRVSKISLLIRLLSLSFSEDLCGGGNHGHHHNYHHMRSRGVTNVEAFNKQRVNEPTMRLMIPRHVQLELL